MSKQEVLQTAIKSDTLSGVIQVRREDVKRRHDLLLAEIQQLREWLGYRPIPTRAHQREMESASSR